MAKHIDEYGDVTDGESVPMDDNSIVAELERLLLNGSHEDVVSFIHPIIGNDALGFKRAKQLLREARDRGKARLTRVHGVSQVILNEFEPKKNEE